MTEIQPYQQNTPAIYLESPALTRLAEWASSAQAAHEVAVNLVQTSFVPEAFRGKAHEATAAILAGAEVGLSPMAALRSFDVINGTAAPRAITLRAVVQAAGHELVVKSSTEAECVIDCRRRGSSNWQTVKWTIARAAKLKLTGKPNWQNQPQAMLLARCTSEAAKLVGADAILGLNGGYSLEEVEDTIPAPTTSVSRTDAPRTSVKRAAAQVAEEPSFDEPVVEQVVDLKNTPITDKTRKHMFALFNEFGLDETAQKAGIGTVLKLGGPIASRADLTEDQGRIVVAALEARKAKAAQAPAPEPADDEPPMEDQMFDAAGRPMTNG